MRAWMKYSLIAVSSAVRTSLSVAMTWACPRMTAPSRPSGLLVGQPPDLGHVLALDPDQPRGALAPGRVEVALVVDVRHPRRQRVGAHVPHLAGPVLGGGLHQRPLVHVGLAPSLTVDRPRGAVIVRRALLRSRVRVGEDAEAELGILVQDLPLRHVVTEMLGDERRVLQDVLEERADLLAAGGTGLGG